MREIAEGFTFYTWLRNFSEHIDEKIEAFQMLAETAANRIFRSQRMTLSMTGHSRSEEAEQIIPMLTGEKIDLAEFMAVPVDGVAAKEWVQIPAGISYAVSAGLLSTQARVYDGGLSVLGNILSLDYLWNEIRVQGGAYGCGFRVSETGSTMFYSYRDPAPADSLKIFADTAGYIRSFCSSEQVIDPYIISTVAATEPLRTCAQEGLVADSDYFCGITYAQRCRFREQMRNLKTKDLLSYCDLFDALSSSSAYCVVGGEEAIQPKTEDWLIYTL